MTQKQNDDNRASDRANQTNRSDLDSVLREFIRSMLKSGVLTQQDLSQYSGLSRSGLAHWLNGERSMTLRNASRLVALFGYSRFGQYMISHARPDCDEIAPPDLLHLLEQMTSVLRSLLERQGKMHASLLADDIDDLDVPQCPSEGISVN